MKSDCRCTRLALGAIFGGVSAFAGLCLDRNRPLMGCVVGLGLGVSIGVVVARLLEKDGDGAGLYSTGTRYYEDHQTESGL